MISPALFAIGGGILELIGGPFYLYDILKGHTKPQRTTWFIWTVEGMIALFASLQLGAHWSLVFVALNAIGNLAVFLLSLKYGEGGWLWIDKLALIVSVIGFGVSLAVRSPVIALAGVILADFAGLVPTLIKTYHEPDSETSVTWFAIGTAALLGVFAVGNHRLSLLAYPLYIAIANYAVLAVQGFSRFKSRI
jgi:hypothetical protein